MPAPGGDWRMLSTPPWSMSTGSTTAASTASLAWSPRPSSRRRMISRRCPPCGQVPNELSLYQTRGGSAEATSSVQDDVAARHFGPIEGEHECQVGLVE